VLNSLNDKGAGFGVNTNKVTIINNKEDITNYDLKPKAEVAKDILSEILKLINA
jgi:phosphopantothenoylcysteine decarboxylase/phosphopantothenate--cysteine ligase